MSPEPTSALPSLSCWWVPPKRNPNWESESYLGWYLGTWVALLMPLSL